MFEGAVRIQMRMALEEVSEGKKDLAPTRIADRSSNGKRSQRSSGNYAQEAVLTQEGTPLRRPHLAPC
jgi:hypothetical protein